MHAHGELAEVASKFIAISMPANVPLAIGMTFSGVLRAVGDARRAMYVTLSAGIATAFLDPLLIFGFGLGVYGAAWATVLSRLILLAVGWLGAVGVHDLVARPKLNAARSDFGPIMAIGFPAIMANMAAPVSSAYTLRVFSDFGEPAIAASAIIDRVTPVAFGVIFALTGSVGPIIGQNYGARLMGRVQRDADRFLHPVDRLRSVRLGGPGAGGARPCRRLRGQGRERAICRFLLPIRRFRLDLPGVPVRRQRVVQQSRLSGAVDGVQLGARDAWGRFRSSPIGARYGGVQGGMLGFALGGALFGLIAVATAYAVTWRLAKAMDGRTPVACGPRQLGEARKRADRRRSWKRAGDAGEAVFR